MRIWDALRRPYSLSVSYIARVVRIDPDETAKAAKPVVIRHFDVSDRESGGAV